MMCEYGDTVPILVKIPVDLSCTGETRWVAKPIDRCIATIVEALQCAGIDMRASCCGHGRRPGEILLQDGRILQIKAAEAAEGADHVD